MLPAPGIVAGLTHEYTAKLPGIPLLDSHDWILMISLVATIYTAAEGSVVFLGRTVQTASPGAMLAKGGLLRPGDSEIEHSPALNDRYCEHAESVV